MSPEQRAVRAGQLQERLEKLPPLSMRSDEELLRGVRNYLRIAVEEEVLTNPPHELFQIVKRDPSPNPGEFLIVGGDKNKRRDPGRPSLRRRDGGWFHFAITGRKVSSSNAELLGYNFEFCFPGEPLQFLRFDMNSPTGQATANIDKGLRSHFHPNHDHIQVPAAALDPLELLDLFVYGLHPGKADC